jgi:hypothetical protein
MNSQKLRRQLDEQLWSQLGSQLFWQLQSRMDLGPFYDPQSRLGDRLDRDWTGQ